MRAYTDYPFVQLGDAPNQPAPVREIDAVEYDGDKYMTVTVEGVTTQIKAGYCYQTPGRFGTVPALTRRQLTLLTKF